MALRKKYGISRDELMQWIQLFKEIFIRIRDVNVAEVL